MQQLYYHIQQLYDIIGGRTTYIPKNDSVSIIFIFKMASVTRMGLSLLIKKKLNLTMNQNCGQT